MEKAIIDFKSEAERIICEHTEAMMSGVLVEFEDDSELFDYMISECAFILTKKFLEGKYTPLEYNNIRNELTVIFGKIFFPEETVEKKERTISDFVSSSDLLNEIISNIFGLADK